MNLYNRLVNAEPLFHFFIDEETEFQEGWRI